MMMMMDASNIEEEDQMMMVIKGKRTKRPRFLSSSILLTTTPSSSSSPSHDDDHENMRMIGVGEQDDETEMSTTEEEEDTAKCLILLAHSGPPTQIGNPKPQQQQQQQQQHPIQAVAANNTTRGLYGYECKTCNRCFSSFQALGGHRASHTKPSKDINNVTNTTQPKKALSFTEEQNEYERRFYNNTTSTTLSLQVKGLGNGKGNKVHECSVCGAEFASGQALGGHMRRHRTLINNTNASRTTPSDSIVNSTQYFPQASDFKRPRSVLELDLNLPAPEEERFDIGKLPFSSSKKEQVIVFSASPFVGCRY